MLAIPIISMVCIAALEGLALWQGVDGTALCIVVAALAGIGGYELKTIATKVRRGK